MMSINRTLAAAALAAAFFIGPAEAGYVTFRCAPGTPWCYWTIFFHTGGTSNLSLQGGQNQCQSQIEPGDMFCLSYSGIPRDNCLRGPLAPYIRNQCS
jgi:hypothetical protein